jgi:hypothetical protein
MQSQRCLIAVGLIVAALSIGRAADDPSPAGTESPPAADAKPASLPPPELFTGKVVYLKDALEERKIETAEETAQHVVLQTDTGELIPILADWRGRAFYQDERLRNRKVELIGFRHPGVPYLNVLSIYLFDEKDQRNYMDYWCDVCGIAMYEIQDCKCCQGPIEFRLQRQDLPDYITRKPGSATPAAVPK